MSARQFYIILAIGIISMKMQKLPCLVNGSLGKDGWLLFLFFILINIIGILLVFFIFKFVKPETVLNKSKNIFFDIFRKIIMVCTAFYFLMESILLYEHIQSIFASALFDNLSWAFFSFFLLFAVFFLAHRGIENIALNYELYVWIIVSSFVLITILGVNHSDLTAILPFETINLKTIASKIMNFNCWFGDFIFVLYLGIKARDIKLSKTLLVYISSMLFVVALFIIFIGIYGEYSPIEPGLISVLSEQSMLGLNIGRVDWFLILFVEMGAVLSCSVCLYFSNFCLHSAFLKIKPIFLKLINISLLYYFDIFYLVDLNTKVNFYCGFMSYSTIIVESFTFLFLIIIALNNKIKSKNKHLIGAKI